MASSTSSTTNALPREQSVPCLLQTEHEQLDCPKFFLPNELIAHCLSFLHHRDLVKTRLVCWDWRDLSDEEIEKRDPKELFPKLTILDGNVWKMHINMENYGLEVDDTKPPSKRQIIVVMKELFAKLKIERNAGITLLAVPKGYSLAIAEESARAPLEGNSTGIRFITDEIKAQLGEEKVKKTYYVAITNSVLENSRNISIEQQEALVKEYMCEIPPYLSLVALNLLTCITSSAASPIYLYDNSTYSRGKEAVRFIDTTVKFKYDYFNTIVGDFTTAGLYVFDKFQSYELNKIGVAALRKF